MPGIRTHLKALALTWGTVAACGQIEVRRSKPTTDPTATEADRKPALTEGADVSGRATVLKVEADGGGYYLHTDDDEVFVPVSLPEELRKIGTRIDFKAALLRVASSVDERHLVKIESYVRYVDGLKDEAEDLGDKIEREYERLKDRWDSIF